MDFRHDMNLQYNMEAGAGCTQPLTVVLRFAHR